MIFKLKDKLRNILKRCAKRIPYNTEHPVLKDLFEVIMKRYLKIHIPKPLARSIWFSMITLTFVFLISYVNVSHGIKLLLLGNMYMIIFTYFIYDEVKTTEAVQKLIARMAKPQPKS